MNKKIQQILSDVNREEKKKIVGMFLSDFLLDEVVDIIFENLLSSDIETLRNKIFIKLNT